MARRLVFVTGPGCGLCARAWTRLIPLRALGLVGTVDVTDHVEWLERIPVLLSPGGTVVWEQAHGGSPLGASVRFLLAGKR